MKGQTELDKGISDLPEHWRYSSTRSYMGEESLLPNILKMMFHCCQL
ncbi:MAG: hypothetical protein KAG26_00680 [Methylococcales bacterium]|nr:hypothetical protein [Methylococcales bacterium]